jgi:O-antigen/teichoic acid export membrane protein
MCARQVAPLANPISRKFQVLRDVLRRQDFSLSKNRISELTWLGGGQVLTVVLSMISVKLMTSLGADEYGKLTLSTSVASLLILCLFGPMEQAYVRLYFEHAGESRRLRIFKNSLLRTMALALLLVAAVVALLIVPLQNYAELPAAFTLMAGWMVLAALLNVPLGGILGAMRKRKEMALILVGERVIMIAVLFYIVRQPAASSISLMFAIAIATTLSAIARIVIYLRARGTGTEVAKEPVDVKKTLRELRASVLQYASPFILWGAFAWLQSNGERWVIGRMLSTADVGRYGLAYGLIANSGALAFTIMSQYLTPVIYQCFASNTDEGRTRAMDLIRLEAVATALVFAITGVVLYFWGDIIIRFLSNSGFTLDAGFLILLSAGIGIFHMAQALTTVGMTLRKPEKYIRPKVVAAIASVLFYLVGCYMFGLPGIALAIIFASTLYLFWVSHTNHRMLLPQPDART